MILVTIIIFLFFIILYLYLRLKAALKILQTLKPYRNNKKIIEDKNYIEKPYMDLLNEASNILETKIDSLPEKAEKLAKKYEFYRDEYHKCIQREKKLKIRLSKKIAENLKRKVNQIYGYNLYCKHVDSNDHFELSKICKILTKKNKSIVIMLYQKNFTFLMISASHDLIDKGFDFVKIIDKISNKIGGKGGVRLGVGIIKSNKIIADLDVLKYCENLVKKEIEMF